MSLNIAKSIKNSGLCKYDTLEGFISSFNENGDIDGWDIYNNIYMFNSWNGVLFGRTNASICYISRSSSFSYLDCSIYYIIKISMKIMPNQSSQGELLKGRLQWLTIEDDLWDSNKLYDFDIISDGKWHTYELNVGPHKYWLGHVNNLRIYPFIDAWPNDFFAIERISIASYADRQCLNPGCSYYSEYVYPCKGVGVHGSCTAGISKKGYSLISGISDEFIINIDGYGDEVFNLGDCIDFDGYEIAKRLSKHISSLSIGGYTYCSVEVDEFDINKLKIISGTVNSNSTVKVVDSPAARELGFYDNNGNNISSEEVGADPASGFDFLTTRLLSTFEINGMVGGTLDSSSYLHSPMIYSVEGGRSDYLSVNTSFLTSSYTGGEIFNHSMKNQYKTIIDISNPINSNGKIKYICFVGRAYNNNHKSQILIIRPYRDGNYEVIHAVDIDMVSSKSTIEFYKLQCDLLVNKGDVLGIYNAELCIPFFANGYPDATFYHMNEKPEGKFNPGTLYNCGSSGFPIYARSDSKQNSVILDIDFGKRINIEKFNIYGYKNDKFEYNVSSCKDFVWTVDTYGSSHTHNHNNGNINHTNLVYGIGALNDNIVIADDPYSSLTFGVANNGYWTSGPHTYCYINGDNEFKDPGVGGVDISYSSQVLTYYLKFPNEVSNNLYKSKIFFKDYLNFQNFELSYYLGAGSFRGDITLGDTSYKRINYNAVKIDGLLVDKEDKYKLNFYNNPTSDLKGIVYKVIEHDFDSISAKGFRIDCFDHRSTKLVEIELYSWFEEDIFINDVPSVRYSSYGEVWYSSIFSREPESLTSMVYADITNAPRYITLELNSRVIFNLNFIEVLTGSQVKLADCNNSLLLDNSKTNSENASTPLVLENVYNLPFDVSVDIPKQTFDSESILLWSRLDSYDSLDNSEVGPKCFLHKNSDFKFLDDSSLCSKENECYGLNNMVSGKYAYKKSNESVWTKWPYVLQNGVEVGYGSTANRLKNDISFDGAIFKFYKLYCYDTNIGSDTDIISAVRSYFDDGEQGINRISIQVGNVQDDELGFNTVLSEDRSVVYTTLVDENFTTGSGIYNSFEKKWYFFNMGRSVFSNPLNSFELYLVDFTNGSIILFYDDNNVLMFSIMPYSTTIISKDISDTAEISVVIKDEILKQSVTFALYDSIIKIKRVWDYFYIFSGDENVYTVDTTSIPKKLPSYSLKNCNTRPVYAMEVAQTKVVLKAIPSLTPYELITLGFNEPISLDKISLYTKSLATTKYGLYASYYGNDYVCLGTNTYESSNLSEVKIPTGIYIYNDYVNSYYTGSIDVLRTKQFIPWATASSSGIDDYFVGVKNIGQPTHPGVVFAGSIFNGAMSFWKSGDISPHWIKYDFGYGYKRKIEQIKVVFGQKSSAYSTRSYINKYGVPILYSHPGGCPAELYIQGSNTDTDGSVYSGDLTSVVYEHYSDKVIGVNDYDVSDNNLSSYIQNFTYVAVDFGDSNRKSIMCLRLYLLNSYAYSNIKYGIFYGSNDSSNGVDGTWYELVSLSSLLQPTDYPGWTGIVAITNLDKYRWYKISGTPANNNTVLNEWEMFESNDVDSINKETWGLNTNDAYSGFTKNVTIFKNLPTVNSAYDTNLYIGCNGLVGNSNRIIMKFDLSDFLSDYYIYSATLNLFHFGGGLGTSNHTISIYRCYKNWDVYKTTWNEFDLGYSWGIAGANNASDSGLDGGIYDRTYTAEVSKIVNNNTTNRWINFNITNLVKQWINKEIDNNGLMLISSLENTANECLSFYSSSNVDLYRPHIIISYGQKSESGWVNLFHTTNITSSNVNFSTTLSRTGSNFSLYTFTPITNTYNFTNNNYYRFYRLYMPTVLPDSEEWITIYRMEMREKFSGPGSLVDAAYHKPVESSSYLSSTYIPEKANDDNVSTYWSSISGTGFYPHWWTVDMKYTFPIKKISVSLSNYNYAYVILSGLDIGYPVINTWNPNDATSGLTFSNDNLTISIYSSTYYVKGTRSIYGKAKGKWYWEITIGGSYSTFYLGISRFCSSLEVVEYGIYFPATGLTIPLVRNNSTVGQYILPNTNYRTAPIGIAYDADNGELWFRFDGVWQGDPVTGTNPAFSDIDSNFYFPHQIMVNAYAYTHSSTTAFDASNFMYSIPDGFKSMNEIGEITWKRIQKESSGVYSPKVYDDLLDINCRYMAITLTSTNHPNNKMELLEFNIIPYGIKLIPTVYTDYFAVDLGKRYSLGMVRNYGTGSFTVGINNSNTVFSNTDTSNINDVVWSEEQSLIDSFDDGVYYDKWEVSDISSDGILVESGGEISVFSYGTASGNAWHGPSMTYTLEELAQDFDLDVTFRCGVDSTFPYAGAYTIDFLYKDRLDPVLKLKFINPITGEVSNNIREYLYDNSDPESTICVKRWGKGSNADYDFIEDRYIHSSTNYSYRYTSFEGIIVGYYCQTCMKFDLSCIDGAEILEAKLYIRTKTTNLFADANTYKDINLYRCYKPWISTDVCWYYYSKYENNYSWNGITPISDLGEDDGSYARAATPFATQRIYKLEYDVWFNWDITDMVKKWVSGEIKNYGFIMGDGGDSIYVDFYDSFDADEYRPYLEIKYKSNGLKFVGSNEMAPQGATTLSLSRSVSESQLIYKLNNITRYIGNITKDSFNKIRITYERFNTLFIHQQAPVKHNTSYFKLKAVTKATDARWVRFALDFDGATTRYIKKLGIYPDISTNVAPGGGLNCSWTNLGELGKRLTSVYINPNVNYALNAKVTSNYILGNCFPENAVDGEIEGYQNSGWAFDLLPDGEYPYIEIDFGKVITINTIVLYNGPKAHDKRFDNFPYLPTADEYKYEYHRDRFYKYNVLPSDPIYGNGNPLHFKITTTTSGENEWFCPWFFAGSCGPDSFYYPRIISSGNNQYSCTSIPEGKFDTLKFVFTPVKTRRLRVVFQQWKSPGIPFFNSDENQWSNFYGSFLREIEVYNTSPDSEKVYSELWPILAFDLRYQFKLIKIDYLALSRCNIQYKYSSQNYSDPHKVSFISDDVAQLYGSSDTSGILKYYDGTNIYNTSYTFDSNIFLSTDTYNIRFGLYNIEASEDMCLSLVGNKTYDIYPTLTGTLSGTGIWSSFENTVYIEETGYFDVIGKLKIDTSVKNTNNYEWGIRYPIISRNTDLGKRWLSLEVPQNLVDSFYIGWVKAYTNQRFVLTEFSLWWNAMVSTLSDSDITKVGNTSLKISYPSSFQTDTIKYYGAGIGRDLDWSIKDILCFWLYIENISKIDLDTFFIYCGKIKSDSTSTTQTTAYYVWKVSDVFDLTTGWNRVELPFDKYSSVIPFNVQPTPSSFLDSDLDFAFNESSFSFFQIKFAGKGASFYMCLDDIGIKRNVFNDTLRYGKGLCLVNSESLEIPLSNVDLRKGTIEFWLKTYYTAHSTDMFGKKYSKNLFTISNNTNMISLGITSGYGFQISIGENMYDIRKHVVRIDSDSKLYFGINTLMHIALVWSNDGMSINGSTDTLKLYVNGNNIYSTDDRWVVSCSTPSVVRLGGASKSDCYDTEPLGSGVFENLKIYNYCKTSFDSLEDIKNIFTPNDFIEISDDNVNFYGSGSSNLPLVFEKVLPDESVIIYVRSLKDDNFYNTTNLTAGLNVEWEVSV